MVNKIQECENEDLECLVLKIKSNLNVKVNFFMSYIPPRKDDQLKPFSNKMLGLHRTSVIYIYRIKRKAELIQSFSMS